jgi:hypothetical protein
MTTFKMPTNMPSAPPFSGRTRALGALGLVLLAAFLFLNVSLARGGHMAGPTHIAPGNVGLVIDNYHGNIEKALMPAGTHWQGIWETVIEVPTAQRTLSLTSADAASGGAVQVNTASNMLQVDVSAQYRIDPDKADDLYRAYQDQFADLRQFEAVNLEPAVKGAVNYAVGDTDTATALTTVGKQQAERQALQALNDEWAARGVVFSNLMIRGIQQDQQSKDLLATTLAKMQDIDNARLALQQQGFDNQTLIQTALADAKVNRLQNSTLTDLYVQDQELGRVKKLYLPSDQLLGVLNK